MNEDQSKRLGDAADAVIGAAEAVEDARTALDDKRFDSEQERERLQASQQAASRLEAAGKKIEEALRKGTVASAASGRTGAYPRYVGGADSVRQGRATARLSLEQDGTASKRTMAREALVQLEAGLATAAAIVFGDTTI